MGPFHEINHPFFGYPWLWKPNIYQSITISHYSPPFTTMNHHIHSTWNIHEIFTIHFLDTSMAVETHHRSIQGSGDEARNGSSTSPAPWCPLAAPASRPRGPRRRALAKSSCTSSDWFGKHDSPPKMMMLTINSHCFLEVVCAIPNKDGYHP